MKPIDLSKVTHTRGGQKVHIAHLLEGAQQIGAHYPIVAIVEEVPGELATNVYTIDGRIYRTSSEEHRHDLIEEEPYADFVLGEPAMMRNGLGIWERRHFAGVGPSGKPLAFYGGKSQWSADASVSVWDECRRPTAEELAERGMA